MKIKRTKLLKNARKPNKIESSNTSKRNTINIDLPVYDLNYTKTEDIWVKNKSYYFKESKKSVDNELSHKLTEDGYVNIKADKQINKTIKELRSFNSNID